MEININDIVENNYLLSAFGFSNLSMSLNIKKLKNKYPNLMEKFNYKDGYAFDSKEMFDEGRENLVPLIQINSVNEPDFLVLKDKQSIFVPKTFINEFDKYCLNQKAILISLTGGSDVSKNISTFFDGSFSAMLNQRVCSYTTSEDIDILYYFYAMTLSSLFKKQWMGNGGIQKNTSKKEKETLYLPLVDKNSIKYISLLIQALINKSKMISEKHNKILEEIQKELENNQKPNIYKYSMPTIDEIMELDRMDSSLYSNNFKEKEFLITNYKEGTSNISDMGFKFVRGNNLAISVIGKSIYSNEFHKGFYSLVLPKNISKYGTLNKVEYLGNNSKMIEINQGAIVFGAEGNEKGRSWVAIDETMKTITNFHGLTLYQEDSNMQKSIFVKLFLDYLRSKGMIDDYATGGNGGSLSIKYWEVIPFPNFPDGVEKKLVLLYHNSKAIYDSSKCNLSNFLEYDDSFNQSAGIYELDKSMNYLKQKLDEAINDIVNDVKVKVEF